MCVCDWTNIGIDKDDQDYSRILNIYSYHQSLGKHTHSHQVFESIYRHFIDPGRRHAYKTILIGQINKGTNKQRRSFAKHFSILFNREKSSRAVDYSVGLTLSFFKFLNGRHKIHLSI